MKRGKDGSLVDGREQPSIYEGESARSLFETNRANDEDKRDLKDDS